MFKAKNSTHTNHGIGNLVSSITQTSSLQDKIFGQNVRTPLNHHRYHDRDHDYECSCKCDLDHDRDRKRKCERECECERDRDRDVF